MEINDINTYFPVEFRGKDKRGAVFHVYPQTVFTKEQRDEICNEIHKEKYFGLYTNTECSAEYVRIVADASDFPKKDHNEVLQSILTALNNAAGIKKVIISPEYVLTDDDDTDDDEYIESGEFDWDNALGLTKLDLNYPAHAEGIEGECFNYSIYFTDGTANDDKANDVTNAINDFDFKLTGDDYMGYLDVSAESDKVSVYLDLGNVAPQNENKIIHGILLALNSVKGIKNVIVNEGCGDFDF